MVDVIRKTFEGTILRSLFRAFLLVGVFSFVLGAFQRFIASIFPATILLMFTLGLGSPSNSKMTVYNSKVKTSVCSCQRNKDAL